MGILILVNYGPIWKCGPLRESMMAISRRVDGPDDLINLEVWYWSTQDERENVYC
jgi:hypothetical protein